MVISSRALASNAEGDQDTGFLTKCRTIKRVLGVESVVNLSLGMIRVDTHNWTFQKQTDPFMVGRDDKKTPIKYR